MRGGKFLNNWRMAELHAQEAPDRVWELETYGALFDRTKDGKISQRNFGGHTYPRLAHVGDRTGLELIRTLQQKIVSLQQEDKPRDRRLRGHASRSSPSARSPSCSTTAAGSPARSATGARPATSSLFEAPAVVLATGGIGKSFKVTIELVGVHRRRARAGAARRRHADQHGVHPVPPDRHGLAAVGARASWSPSRCAVTAACCSNSEGKRFMFDYIPDVFKGQYAETEEEADRWYNDNDNNRRPPELLPRDEVARAINSEVKAGRGTPHGGVFLDIASRLPAEEIKQAAAVDVPPVQGAGRRRHHQASRWRSARPATT